MTTTTARTPDCNHCRRRPAAPARKRCRPCLDKAAANSRRRYARLAARAACTRCGRHPAMPGESRCSALRARPAEVVAAADPLLVHRDRRRLRVRAVPRRTRSPRRRRHAPHRTPLRRVRRLRPHRTRRRAGPRRHPQPPVLRDRLSAPRPRRPPASPPPVSSHHRGSDGKGGQDSTDISGPRQPRGQERRGHSFDYVGYERMGVNTDMEFVILYVENTAHVGDLIDTPRGSSASMSIASSRSKANFHRW